MNISAVTEASPAIQIHLAAAVVALGLGCLMWARRKGTKSHKMIGRGFVACMVLAAFRQVISSIRAGKIERHKKHVRNLFYFALLIPGAFAFLPGRTMWMLFFG